MLIEFRVKNFRSIQKEQCLSLVAAKDSTFKDSHTQPGKSKAALSLLKSAVIYGQNAGGKSNIINALAFMRTIVETSATQIREGQQFNCPPFKLDSESKHQPSEFEITFLDQGVRYQYGFALTAERVVEEWLLVYKTAKPQMWFSRSFDSKNGKDKYEFGSHLTGQRSLWQESTRSNALFLSKAVDLNSERLRPIFLWIVQKLIIFQAGILPLFNFSIQYAQSKAGKAELLRFLNAADLSIEDLTFENKKVNKLDFHLEAGKSLVQTISEGEELVPLFWHKGDEGRNQFEWQDESSGTQRFFAFAGPLLDVLKNGQVLVVDELDNSLHTLLVNFIIDQFHSKNNKQGAQLIFTTHDSSLLDKDIFRRDQIWFVKKDRAEATTLYPLSDFSPRKNEALGRGYLIGRYGALPFIGDFEL